MSYKYKFKLENLDCPNCARKIEEALNKHPDIIQASVNFSNLSVSVECQNNDAKEIVREVVNKIEPSINVLDSNDTNNKKNNYDLIRLIVGLGIFGLSLIIKNSLLKEILIILAYAILLYRVVKKAFKMLLNLEINENLLITISCVGAYLTNNVHEGLMVITLYEIGKILESKAVNNSRKSISDLMDIKPEYANLLIDDKINKVNPETVKINDIIVVKQGEKVPLDGIVVSGSCNLDVKALTGESTLKKVGENDEVLSGSINNEGLIKLKVTKLYKNSTVSQILNLVENAADKKAKTENFVSKAAKIYTPIILLLAILIMLILPIFPTITFHESIYRALVFLVVSCPCAIAISVPLSYFSGIGASSREGILIKGSDYLEAASKIKEIIFDKTGTITNGDFLNYELKILDKSYTKDEVMKYYVSGEVLSNHPIATSIINNFTVKSKYRVKNFQEIAGNGLAFEANKKMVKIGSSIFCNSAVSDSSIYLNIDNHNVAKLIINDGIKENAKEVVDSLKKLGINVQMFTGDNKEVALDIARKIAISDVHYELLPKDKFELLEKEIKNYNGNVCFVGDGINDAPALRIAKIGISMGSIGSEAAIESSDIVIMNDNLESILTLINISKKTNRIIKQNLIFAIGVKVIVLLLSSLGIASMWQAVFADTGVTLLTIINTTRILKK